MREEEPLAWHGSSKIKEFGEDLKAAITDTYLDSLHSTESNKMWGDSLLHVTYY